MKIAANIEILETGSLYPVLIWDNTDVVLIDTGFPGQFELLQDEIVRCGFKADQITKVILTHQDADHVGSAKILSGIGAKIMAYQDEVPYIQGDKTPVKIAAMEAQLDKLSPDQLAFYKRMKAGMSNFFTHVDHQLADGETIPVCGGIKVVHTPGHTPGHMALLLCESGVLVCGDAANICDGKLCGANPEHTVDIETAEASFKIITSVDANGYICYHGGYLAK